MEFHFGVLLGLSGKKIHGVKSHCRGWAVGQIGLEFLFQGGPLFFKDGVVLGDFGLQGDNFRFVRFAGVFEINKRLSRARYAGVAFIAIVEIGEELVVLLLGELIVFVVMAAGAADGEAKPN